MVPLLDLRYLFVSQNPREFYASHSPSPPPLGWKIYIKYNGFNPTKENPVKKALSDYQIGVAQSSGLAPGYPEWRGRKKPFYMLLRRDIVIPMYNTMAKTKKHWDDAMPRGVVFDILGEIKKQR